jgi:hypothetical protein
VNACFFHIVHFFLIMPNVVVYGLLRVLST